LASYRKSLVRLKNLLANTGYFSEANVEKCTQASLVPFKPREHNLSVTERFRVNP
jgi:hypothetical protein